MSKQDLRHAGITHYTAWVERDGDWWLVRVEGVGATQAVTRGKAWKMAVDLILEVDDLAVGEYTLAVNYSAEP